MAQISHTCCAMSSADSGCALATSAASCSGSLDFFHRFLQSPHSPSGTSPATMMDSKEPQGVDAEVGIVEDRFRKVWITLIFRAARNIQEWPEVILLYLLSGRLTVIRPIVRHPATMPSSSGRRVGSDDRPPASKYTKDTPSGATQEVSGSCHHRMDDLPRDRGSPQ